jgi:hypothetical protein
MARLSRRSTGWMGIPAADFWVCPECQEASDPDLWVTKHMVWCPECGLGFAGRSGAREIARRTLAQIGDETVVDPAVGSALLSPLSGAA